MSAVRRLSWGRLPLYLVACIAHWAVYLWLLAEIAPMVRSEAAATLIVLLMLVASGLAAAAWPVVNYWLVMALAASVILVACLAVAIGSALAWLAGQLAARMDDVLPFR